MPDRPLLILPSPGEPIVRRRRFGGGDKVHRPDRDRQAIRLGPKLQHLQRALDARRIRVQAQVEGIVPEEVLVLEIIGTVDNFIRAVRRIPGMEWLGEIDEGDIPPDEDFYALSDVEEPRFDKPLHGRVFLVFTNQEALSQMLRLWNMWQEGERLPHGQGRWRHVFENLRDIRTWGIKDRLLETGVLQDWSERAGHNEGTAPVEIELWYRQTTEQRRVARDRVRSLVDELGGEVIGEALVDEISYHALVGRLPLQSIRLFLGEARDDVELAQCEQIQFFRAAGQMAALVPDDDRFYGDGEPQLDTSGLGEPVVALMDGLPLQAHQRLAGLLVVDDPDDFESSYPAQERRHGTAMASLIINGDLNTNEPRLNRRLYVRPILQPDPLGWRGIHTERVPENVLIVDLVHRAVRRLFVGEGDNPPSAPEVRVINLSVCIRDRPFEGSLSPLARLLDWLSWTYNVLFVVSAGNYSQSISVPMPPTSFEGLSASEVQRVVVRTVASDARNRGLMSPSEAINVLSVAGSHYDDSGSAEPPGLIDPYLDSSMPSPINAQGMGYRRAVKPDLLAPGGRVLLRQLPRGNRDTDLSVFDRAVAPGQRVPAPGATAGQLDALWFTRGTSNAAAVTSRAAAFHLDMLGELRDDPGAEVIDTVPSALWLKALLAHGADWQRAGDILETLLVTPDNRQRLKEHMTRMLGYGLVDFNRVRECTEYRATALSGGVLSRDEAHIHRFPLPPSLSGEHGLRRLFVTLAWFSPVNPFHHAWRRAHLWFSAPYERLQVDRRQAHWQTVQRGTLQHEIMEGDRAAVFVDGDDLEIQVNCRAEAGALDDEVPYALITTLEIAEEVGIPIYDEIQARVHARVRVRPAM